MPKAKKKDQNKQESGNNIKKKKSSQGKKKKSKVREYTESIIIAIILALFIRTFFVQAFRIPSGSMEDTLLIGDFLLVNKFIYGTHIPFTDIKFAKIRRPQPGDIIVFKSPDEPKKDFIKRVIAVEGDTIKIINKQLYINGEKQIESYIKHIDPKIYPSNPRYPRDNYGPVVVPEGHLFMMGDNRDNSRDSRFWGFLNEDEVKGQAFILYFSLNNEKCLWGILCQPRFGRIGQLIQ